MRNVTIELCEEFDDFKADNVQKVNAALGYLATWAIHSERYANVAIYGDKEGCLHVTYRDKAGAMTYGIYGMWNEDSKSYSFHS